MIQCYCIILQTFMDIVRVKPSRLQYVENQTFDICLSAILVSPFAIKYVDPTVKHYQQLVLVAVELNPLTIRCVPNASHEAKYKAIELSPHAIRYIKDATTNMFLETVRWHSEMTPYILSRSPKIARKLLQANHQTIMWFENPSKKTIDFAIRCINEHVPTIETLMQKCLSVDMMRYAVSCNGSVLKLLQIPDEQYLKVIQTISVGQSISECFANLMRADRRAIAWIKPEYLDHDLVNQIVELYYKDIRYITPDIPRYEEIATCLVKKNGMLISSFKEVTPAMCFAAVHENRKAIELLPKDLVTIDLVRMVVDDSLAVLCKLDLSEVIERQLYHSHPHTIRYLKSPLCWMWAIEAEPTLAFEIPEETSAVIKLDDPQWYQTYLHLTEQKCVSAVLNGLSIKKVPSQHKLICTQILKDDEITNTLVTLYFSDFIEKECPICFEDDAKMGYALDCGHEICISCMIKIESNLCPMCRQPYSGILNTFSA